MSKATLSDNALAWLGTLLAGAVLLAALAWLGLADSRTSANGTATLPNSDAQPAGEGSAHATAGEPKPAPPTPAPAIPAGTGRRNDEPLAEYVPYVPALNEKELLEYEILWNGLSAGRAQMQVKAKDHFRDSSGPMVWIVRLETRSNLLVTKFYPVNDKADSHIDAQGGFSRFFYQIQNEGNYSIKERQQFDYAVDKMTAFYERPREDNSWSSAAVPLPGKMLDPLALLYYIRSLPLDGQKTFLLPVCADRRVWNAKLVPLGRESLSVKCVENGKPQPCFIYRPEYDYNGLFVRKGEMKIWLHEKYKVPLKFSVELPIGPCELLLSKHAESPFGAN